MKAVVLAAGVGSRLRPMTDHLPKCLVPVQGRALLDLWLDSLATAGVDEVLVNLHHLPDLVLEHLGRRVGPPAVVTAYEPRLLGSAGTLRANSDFFAGEDLFLAVNGDNLTDFDPALLADAQRASGGLATLGVFRTPRPEACGIVEARDGLVVGFEEKPAVPRSDLANAGLYAFSPEIVGLVRDDVPQDIGFHLLPQLVGRARVLDIGDAFFLDIGTPEAYAVAEREWGGVGCS
ncbi:nucleotidyltransferase family protein [Nocardioides astragali]|uniref:NDP-sugar synthase n=1 Tax=Nocardioides astragali TaxID=1776736 RepID=A0ABW2N2X6_9ACTN|nr:nucleotidyltransferase family protein [Nocardioides astragali]